MKVQQRAAAVLGKVATIAAASALLAGGAQAAIMGDTVNATYLFPDSSTTYIDGGNAVVGAGVEFASGSMPYPFYFFDIDLSNSGVTVTFTSYVSWTSATFNGFRLTDLTKSFDAASFASSTNGGFGAGNFSAAGNTMEFNWQGLNFEAGDVITISAVPEPGTYGMLLAGLGVLGWMSRRRRA